MKRATFTLDEEMERTLRLARRDIPRLVLYAAA